MQVSFYGVRGSIPAPGPSTARYGGNTSCVDVRLADGETLILDAGTGLRELGNALLKNGESRRIHLLISHTHWDHILGLPFFAPLWRRETELVVYPMASDAQERFQRTIFDDIHFPVSIEDIPATLRYEKPDSDVWSVGSARVRRVQLNHPGGSQGFRIEDESGASLAYLTDNELATPHQRVTDSETLARFAEGVDLLIHDAQYVPADMPHKRGWGHSVVDEVLRLGVLASPKRLVLYHHDPDRSDDELDAIGERASAWLGAHAPSTELGVAREGLSFDLRR
jgi:phosphoribosyl 1,2-cyclic phosphodiesterase